jgi:radical SAM superfamily enzyme YgiQ (UPF0313 family)
LVNTNQEKQPYPLVPIGICCVASSLKGCGHQVYVLDLCFSRFPDNDIRKAILLHEPDVIGLSVRNIDNADMLHSQFYLDFARDYVRACRRASNAPIVIGGPAFNIHPDAVLSYLEADFGIVGDGEAPFNRLLQALAGEADFSEVPGLVRWKNGRVARNELHREADINQLPFPRPHEWIDFDRYSRWGAPMPLQTKRGCKFQCIYCVYGLLEGQQHRMRDPLEIAEEMAYLACTARPRSFEFVDSVFNAPESHAKEICEAILRHGLRLPLHTMGINPAPTSLELFDIMRRAGFEGIICTPESASDLVLDRMQKGFTVERVERTAQFVRQVGLPTMWVFLFGGPGEDEKTVQETLRFIDRTIHPPDVVFMTLGIRVYPETTMERIAREEGIIDKTTDLLQPTYYLSPKISLPRLVELVAAEAATHPHYCFISDIQIPWVPALTRLLTLLHLTPPLWRYVASVNRIMKLARRRRVAYSGIG